MDNYLQPGGRVTATNGSGSDAASGGVVVFGDTIRVALTAIANGASGEWAIEGVFTLPATTTDTWSDGDFVYWNATTGKCTSTMSTNVVAGIAIGAKTNGQTTAKIKIWALSTPNVY